MVNWSLRSFPKAVESLVESRVAIKLVRCTLLVWESPANFPVNSRYLKSRVESALDVVRPIQHY